MTLPHRPHGGLHHTVPFVLAAIALIVFATTRVALTLVSHDEVSAGFWPVIAARGLWFDLVTVGFILSPFLLAGAIIPERVRFTRFHVWLTRFVVWLVTALLLLAAIGEFFFWDEFGTRYNFIAVDYLVYTQEVLGNIFQSYPVKTLLAVIAAAAVFAVIAFGPWLRAIDRSPYRGRTRLALAALAVAWPLGGYLAADVDQMSGSGNVYADELSGNGLYSLVVAFFRNELDYDRFYATIPDERAQKILDRLGVTAETPQTPDTLARNAVATAAPAYVIRRPRNVVLITVESLSAEFLGAYGDTRGLTPNLDRIARQGLVFDHVFSTGTRTVRGLEATSLGTPPVPGQAIVRRPMNGHLATLGEMLEHQGYDPYFVYGGNSFFDNMGTYFGDNDYKVVDETDFAPDTVVMENAWGVADEALFTNVEKVIADHDSARPFFVQVMTTSNHRPYTYPDGRVDILSPGGREGAVKYTDYAIGRFIEEAAKQPWFEDTLFVIVADHCASVAGKVDMPVAKYRIPLIFYAPGIVKPGHFIARASQIDLPPTLLDILGKPGSAAFFGRSMHDEANSSNRTFVSNYESLGYYKGDTLIVLKPKRVVESYRVDPVTLETSPGPMDDGLRDEAIAYYQTASRAFKEGKLLAPWYQAVN